MDGTTVGGQAARLVLIGSKPEWAARSSRFAPQRSADLIHSDCIHLAIFQAQRTIPPSTANDPAPALLLRPAVAADVPAIAALTRAAYAKWVPLIGREPLPMLADFDATVRDHRVELLVAGDALVALVDLIPEEGVLLVESLAVAPAFQGRGHGSRLMARAAEIGLELGLPRLRLYTNQAFAENVALYLRLGFAIDRREPFHGGSLVHMSKAIG